ncbi:MAG: hypothetical protein M3O85_04860 [Acidobacteriota bacterium]|nr:hypothetical protein [Acidobacteriota bacterium]
MRFLTATLLLTASLLLAQNPQPAAPPTANPAVDDANAKKARALIDQMIDTLGGQAYLNYQDVYQEGRSHRFYEGRPQGVGGPFFRYWRWPDKERTEYFAQRDWVVLFVGDQGYDTTFRGTRLVDPEDLAEHLHRRDHSLETVLRSWLKEPGTALFYEGSALADQKPAEKVSIINSKNDSVTLYIDTYTHLPIKKTYLVRDPVSRERDQEGELFDHYRLVQGIMTPFNIVRYHNGEMTRQLFMNKVQYNFGASDALFTPPPLHYDRTRK